VPGFEFVERHREPRHLKANPIGDLIYQPTIGIFGL